MAANDGADVSNVLKSCVISCMYDAFPVNLTDCLYKKDKTDIAGVYVAAGGKFFRQIFSLTSPGHDGARL
ncbi:MAG TPA: hypothetical protein DEB25_08410 [Desulfobulbaceae bacterium]|nr:hypothetical protein [Desulfobulbaceae bacterium]